MTKRNVGIEASASVRDRPVSTTVPPLRVHSSACEITVGTPTTISQALECTRKGGTVVLTGLSRTDALASIPTFLFVMQEKRLIGSLYGSGHPAQDIPRLVALYQAGKLKLRELVTRSYRLDGVNEALAVLASGVDARGIIQW